MLLLTEQLLGSTVIKKGVKLENLIQIAHNVIVGENTVMSAQSGISGVQQSAGIV
jgi:UDP-3-O-[3-hydroxymyristoyl] glucosamine N-acyltransferase